MVGNSICQGYTAQTCWVIGQQNQINFNKLWLGTHDLEQYNVGSILTYRGIDKIPTSEYPELEKTYIIVPYDYYGVKYVVIRKRPVPL